MLIDMHAHSAGISKCCKVPYERALMQAVLRGLDGVVLTNHYSKSYLKGASPAEFAERYIAEFQAAKAYGETIGCKVFFGIELTMEPHDQLHMLIYGLGPDFLRKYPDIFDYTQKELYRLVQAEKGLMVQAHPYRKNCYLLNPLLMDGIEINCHPKYGDTYAPKVRSVAARYGLLVTCGGDFHADTYRPLCGMELPEDVKDHTDIRAYLLDPQPKTLCVQEPYGQPETVVV